MTKSEVTTECIENKNAMELQRVTKIKGIRTDNESEFPNQIFDEFCRVNGIIYQKTVPYSPQQNGVAERMNRTITEKARSMTHYKCDSQTWWPEVVKTTVHLINRTTKRRKKAITPFEMCFNTKPKLHYLRLFGCIGYAHVSEIKRTKFDVKTSRCMLLGYASHTKGYKVLDSEANIVKFSRTITPDERQVHSIYEDNMINAEEHKQSALPHVCDTDYGSRSGLHNRGNGDVDMMNGSDDVDMEGKSSVYDIEMDAPMQALNLNMGFTRKK
uniref:Putative polyprotein n=1 Tax=Albugo laibachii Nc14 TaxID=890382 RepID=F0WYR3_9STRA|nr:putative polyprotein [Albugo laibachii Nc14]|eukprot:CCA26622.1 putative polyprotein [Albugo laibachii Nc14]